ncbi:MAG: sugar phosphate nucleotidyltransferase [Candidatus Woesearchaeota archaeon]
MRERVTLTLDAELLKQIDSSVDGHEIKNRSHAIEMLLLKALGGNQPRKALILAGGKNNPLKEITGKAPKVLAPINQTPVIVHVIELFKRYGVKEILIAVHQDAEQIVKFFEGRDLGVKISFLQERFPLGTAGSLKLARPYLTSTFYMANGDELKSINLADMYSFHRDHQGMVTIALTTVDDPSKYGVANLTGNHILDFVEKPKKQNAPSNLINAGLYIMEPEVIDYVPEGFARLENDVFPKLARENKLIGYAFSGQWFSLDSVDDYRKAEKKWKQI